MSNNANEIIQSIIVSQSTTAPVSLSIGFVDKFGIVRHDGIVVHDAPSIVVEMLVNKFSYVSLIPQGLLIPVKYEE